MLRRLFLRLCLATVVAGAIAAIPVRLVLGPELDGPRTAVVAIVFVCLVGKLLYDTLFYDRYQPR